jgi:hypothetical protein
LSNHCQIERKLVDSKQSKKSLSSHFILIIVIFHVPPEPPSTNHQVVDEEQEEAQEDNCGPTLPPHNHTTAIKVITIAHQDCRAFE